jgi:hypothetical protein
MVPVSWFTAPGLAMCTWSIVPVIAAVAKLIAAALEIPADAEAKAEDDRGHAAITEFAAVS